MEPDHYEKPKTKILLTKMVVYMYLTSTKLISKFPIPTLWNDEPYVRNHLKQFLMCGFFLLSVSKALYVIFFVVNQQAKTDIYINSSYNLYFYNYNF